MLRKPALAISVFLSCVLFFGCATTQMADKDPIEVWEGEWGAFTENEKYPVILTVYEKVPAGEKKEIIRGKIKSSFLSPSGENCRLVLNLEATLYDINLNGKARGRINADGGGNYPANGEFNGTMTKSEGLITFSLNLLPPNEMVHVEGSWTLKPVKLSE